MIKKTLYFGNPAYLSLKNSQLVIKLPEVEKNDTLPESFKAESVRTIPEKYRALVNDIAQNIEMNLISYVNLDTLEISPLDSQDSYRIMENFVNNLPDCKEKDRLCDAISGHKPFANFNRIIHDSDYREEWFEFRTKSIEKYVIDNYLDNIINIK
jgi:hypothetical protein